MANIAKFYDGKTALVHHVAVRPTASELILFRPGDSSIVARWPVAELRILGDVEHENVPMVRRKGDHARLLVEDPDLRRQLAIAVPMLAPLVANRPSAIGRTAMFGSLLVVLIAFFWAGVDVGSERLAPMLPHSWQAQLGERVLEELTTDKTMCRGEKGLEAINDLANRLAKAQGYDHEISVSIVEGGPVNAFTLPGGYLVFYSDLIDQAANGAEVAGVLAHELGHVVHYHSMKALARSYGLDLLVKVVTGGYSDLLNTLTSGGGMLLALRHGRAAEREADATGVAMLEKLGLRADGVSTFFERMFKEEKGDMAEKAGIWSSHPPTRERVAATKRPPTGTPPFSDTEWKALRAVCE
jgi:Zn-dependent protease with chaperone function